MPDLLSIFRRRPVGLTCRELVELVTDYLEDGLSAVDRARFEAHLAACDHCSAYLRQMRETIELLGTLPADALTPEAEDDLRAAFRDWRAAQS
jgi:anti-sigma factor RsiW